MLMNADGPEVQRFLIAWHENGRRAFEREHKNLNYDDHATVATTRARFIALDIRDKDGHFLVDRETGDVYSIKAYGRPHRRLGHIAAITAVYEAATAYGETLGDPGYALTDGMLADRAAAVLARR